jgi:hypothetical protein
VRRVRTQSRKHSAVDLAVAKRKADFERPAQLANVRGVFQADPAQQDSRQIVCGGAEARHAESFAAQFFDAVDLGMDPQAKIGAIGETRYRDDRSAAEHRRDHCIRPGDGGLDVAADQRRNHDRARRNENKIGFDAIFVESADVLGHP